MSRVRRGVRAEIAKALSLPRERVVPQARLDDLGVLDVDRYELVVALQIRFGVIVERELDWATVRDVSNEVLSAVLLQFRRASCPA